MEKYKLTPSETSKIFLRSMSCSRALMTSMNRSAGKTMAIEERASQPLAGGLVKGGNQCGMLWGATLAAGARAAEKFGPGAQAQYAAMSAARKMVESFQSKANAVDCREITGADFSKLSDSAVYIASGKAMECKKLAVDWAPSAFETIEATLEEKIDCKNAPVNCASLYAKKLGASDLEATMVAGFAGGIGLYGGACGALAAAIWLAALDWIKKSGEGKDSFLHLLLQEVTSNVDYYPEIKKVRSDFKKITGGKILCSEISGVKFASIEEHSAFLKNSGCAKILS